MKRIQVAMTGNGMDSYAKRFATAKYSCGVSSATEMYLYNFRDSVKPARPFPFPETWKVFPGREFGRPKSLTAKNFPSFCCHSIDR